MKPAEIQSLHTSLIAKVKGILHYDKMDISQRPEVGDWRKATFGSSVRFELLYARTHQEQVATRQMGGNCSVFALHPEGASDRLANCYWVGWFEEWKVKASKVDFALCTAAWSVFVGVPNQQKHQILRAEWDQLPMAGCALSGQPHWHVHHCSPIEAILTEQVPVVQPTASDLPSANTADVAGRLGRLHLAMGAWDEKKKHPQCWQRLAERAQDVVTWGARTLEYLQSELDFAEGQKTASR